MIDERVEKAVKFMLDIAKDNSHGYDQNLRWGEKGDYDCSSLTITAFEKAGFPVKSKYGASYTGDMRQAFLKCGFEEVRNIVNLTTGTRLMRGDILLNEVHHVAVYVGDGLIVQASINELGRAVGGKSGDQTGREINISPYKNYHRGGWDSVLRYKLKPDTLKPITPKEKSKKVGDDEVVEKGKYIVKGKKVELDRIIKDGTQYVKLRDLAKELNVKVEWKADTKETLISPN